MSRLPDSIVNAARRTRTRQSLVGLKGEEAVVEPISAIWGPQGPVNTISDEESSTTTYLYRHGRQRLEILPRRDFRD